MEVEKSYPRIYSIDELDLYQNIGGKIIENNKLESIKDEVLEDIEIDNQIKRDFFEDFEELKNESIEVQLSIIKRYQRIVNQLKEKHGYKCQICGYSFQMDNRKQYCEGHHIKELSKGGSQGPENVIILCANHHRMFHYSANSISSTEIHKGVRVICIEGKNYFFEK